MRKNVKYSYLLFGILMTYFSHYLPDYPLFIGVGEATISSVVAFGSLNGILFGPLLGAIVSGLGVFLYRFTSGYLSENTLMLVSPVFIMLCSVVSGMMLGRWKKIGLYIFSSLIVMWYIFGNSYAFLYPWFHFLVLVSYLIFNRYGMILKNSKIYAFMSLFFASLMGILSDHLAGSIIYHRMYPLSVEVLNSIAKIYPFERGIMALGASFVAFVFLYVLKDIFLSSEDLEDEIIKVRMGDMDDYLHHDVISIIENEEKQK